MATTPVGYPFTAWSTEQLTALINEILGNNDFDGATITGSTINSSAIGGTTPAAGAFTTLTASNTVTLSPANHNVVLSPTGTGTVTIAPATAGTLDKVAIGGTTPALAQFTYVGQSAATGLTASGTDRTGALQLAKAVNVLGTVASGTGVILPAIPAVGAQVIVSNQGANTVAIYGNGSNTIDGTAGATGITMAATHRAMFIATSASAWISVLLGAVAS